MVRARARETFLLHRVGRPARVRVLSNPKREKVGRKKVDVGAARSNGRGEFPGISRFNEVRRAEWPEARGIIRAGDLKFSPTLCSRTLAAPMTEGCRA